MNMTTFCSYIQVKEDDPGQIAVAVGLTRK